MHQTVEPNLWEDAAFFIRTPCTTHAQIHAKGSQSTDLLGVTTGHKGEIVMHQGCPGMDVLCGTPKQTERFLWFPGGSGKNLRGSHCVSGVERCENPGPLPPFPAWEGELAIKIGEPGIVAVANKIGEVVEVVTRLITDCK